MNMSNNVIELIGLSKSYDKKILSNISFNLIKGETLSLIGRSGCGKSTIFDAITNLISYQGNIKVTEKVAYANQKNTLLPWKSLRNSFELIAKLNDTTFKDTDDVLNQFKIKSLLDKHPSQLSGGEKARATIYSIYLSNRKVWLLDEPFSALDNITKMEIYKWFKDITKQYNLSILLITHDIDEALYLSDRIITLAGNPTKISNVFENISKQSKDSILKEL